MNKNSSVLTILKLQSDATSVLNVVNVFSISTNDKPNQYLGNLNLQENSLESELNHANHTGQTMKIMKIEEIGKGK